MKIAGSFLFSFLIFFSSCNLQSEKKGIPIIPGISLEGEFVKEDLIASLDTMNAWGLNSISIEIPLWADSNGMPYVHDSLYSFAKMIGPVLLENQIQLSLSLVTRDRELLTGWFHQTLNTDSSQLNVIVDSLLNSLSVVKPERIVFGPDWVKPGKINPSFLTLITHLKENGILVSHFTDVETAEENPLLNVSDEIAVSFNPGIQSQQRQYYQKWNQRLCELSKEKNKPILLARTNLVGDESSVVLMNLPLFWMPDQVVNGLIMNTVSTRICLADSSPYFGMIKNERFRKQLSSYLGKKP